MKKWSTKLSNFRKGLKENEMITGYSTKEGIFITKMLEEMETENIKLIEKIEELEKQIELMKK